MAYRDMNHTCCGNVPVGSASYGVPGVIQSTPYFPGTHQAFPAGGNHTGTQVIPPSIPMLPVAGTTTTSSSAPPQFPSILGAIAAQTGTQFADQVPSTLQNTFFTPGFLRTQIGRRVRVEFLLGTNLLTDRTGTLVAVGASYIVLRLVDSDDMMMCDIYSIKFVTILL